MSTPGSVEATPEYAEIGVTTNFSFLRGGSHPQEYVHQAGESVWHAIGIADRNTLAGVVRAYNELENAGPCVQGRNCLIGSRLVFIDGTADILAYPRDRAAYGRLCRLLSKGKLAAEKGECHLGFEDLREFSAGLLLVLMPPYRFQADALKQALETMRGSRRGRRLAGRQPVSSWRRQAPSCRAAAHCQLSRRAAARHQ